MVMAKTGCTSCTNWTISFEVWGFWKKTHMLQRHFFYFNLFRLQTFCAFNIHHSKPHLQISTLSNFICCFHVFDDFLSYTTLKLKNTTNELWNGWNLARYHHFTHIGCVKMLRGLQQKLDALRVQIGPSPSKYEGFGWKLVC